MKNAKHPGRAVVIDTRLVTARQASIAPASAWLRAFVVLCLVTALAGCMPSDTSERERGVILTGAELEPFGFAMPTGAIDETWEGRRWFDGSREIEYVYETLDDTEQMPLYLSVNVSWEKSRPDAIGVYGATLLGFKVGTVSEDIESRELTDDCHYGDRCSLLLVTRDKRPLGNQFVLTAGRSVYIVQIFGLYFDEPEAWHEMIVPKVTALKNLADKES